MAFRLQAALVDNLANQLMRIFSRRYRNLYDHLPHTPLGVLRWKLKLARCSKPSRPSSARVSTGRAPGQSDVGLPSVNRDGHDPCHLDWSLHLSYPTSRTQYPDRSNLRELPTAANWAFAPLTCAGTDLRPSASNS